VFTNLEENTDYVFRVRAHTSQGAGPYSEKITVHTERDIVRAPMSVQAVATSDQSVEVWWEAVPSRTKVIGYQVSKQQHNIQQLHKTN
jgi:netrin-G3 ligand